MSPYRYRGSWALKHQMAVVLDDPFDSQNQLFSSPGDMALPEGTIHMASLSLRMYWPQKAQPFIRLFQQLSRTYFLILNQPSPLQNHSERVSSIQQRSAAKPLGMETISRIPNIFERNIRQITSLGFMAFHRMANYHPQRHPYSNNRYEDFLELDMILFPVYSLCKKAISFIKWKKL